MEFLPGSIAGPKLHFSGESASSDVHVNTRMTLFFKETERDAVPAILKQAYYFLSRVVPRQRKRKRIVVLQPHNVICVLVTAK